MINTGTCLYVGITMGRFVPPLHIYKMVAFLAVQHEPAQFKYTHKFLVVYRDDTRHVVLHGYGHSI